MTLTLLVEDRPLGNQGCAGSANIAKVLCSGIHGVTDIYSVPARDGASSPSQEARFGQPVYRPVRTRIQSRCPLPDSLCVLEVGSVKSSSGIWCYSKFLLWPPKASVLSSALDLQCVFSKRLVLH